MKHIMIILILIVIMMIIIMILVIMIPTLLLIMISYMEDPLVALEAVHPDAGRSQSGQLRLLAASGVAEVPVVTLAGVAAFSDASRLRLRLR